MMELLTLNEIRRRTRRTAAVEARVHVQVEAASRESDARAKTVLRTDPGRCGDRMTLRVWSDHPELQGVRVAEGVAISSR